MTLYSDEMGLSTIDLKKDHMAILWELDHARIMQTKRRRLAARLARAGQPAEYARAWRALANQQRPAQKIKFFRVEIIRN
jgi:hypothetical protein